MTAALGPIPSPSPEEVVEISSISDSTIRNLRITDCYHRLSSTMSLRTGAGANWCTFATWASRQAGCTIRGEDLHERLKESLRPGWALSHPIESLWRALLRAGIFNPNTTLGRLVKVIHTPFDAFERASQTVAEGNLKVFAEIGYEFARYLRACPAGVAVDSAPFQEFLSGLRAGPPPDGQDYLRQAFLCYPQQATEMNAPKRAQLLFLANVAIGLHEQTRLQPQIQRAMESAPDTARDLTRRVASVLAPGNRLLEFLLRPFGFIVHRFRRFAREITRRAVTESMMVLSLPGAVLSLGRNLDVAFPPVLAQLTEPELQQIYARFEPLGGSCTDCGAQDWADLRQRMHYILHLFRAFHLAPELMNAPFSPQQMKQLRLGQLPDGRL